MSIVKCFMIEPSGRAHRTIMMMEATPEGSPCPYHRSADIVVSTIENYTEEMSNEQKWGDVHLTNESLPWPTECERCKQTFSEKASRSAGIIPLYKRADTGEEFPISKAPAGAMWFATWYTMWHEWDNTVEPALMVKTPAGEWNIDSRCTNCTLPNDKLHRCWVRTGTPPMITVGKGGLTCAAGAGSVRIGNYHAMLQEGELRPCGDSTL